MNERMSALQKAGLSVTQTWRDVEGFPYQVSDEGHVYSERKEILLRPYFNQTQTYLVVDLRNDGERRQAYIHRLILESFRPEGDEPDTEAHHINGNATDNRLGNLKWMETEQHDDVEEDVSGEFAPVDDAPF